MGFSPPLLVSAPLPVGITPQRTSSMDLCYDAPSSINNGTVSTDRNVREGSRTTLKPPDQSADLLQHFDRHAHFQGAGAFGDQVLTEKHAAFTLAVGHQRGQRLPIGSLFAVQWIDRRDDAA